MAQNIEPENEVPNEIGELRRALIKIHPAIFEAGTPENAAFVAHAKKHGELSAHLNVDALMALLNAEQSPPPPPMLSESEAETDFQYTIPIVRPVRTRSFPIRQKVENIFDGDMLVVTKRWVLGVIPVSLTNILADDVNLEKHEQFRMITWRTRDRALLTSCHEGIVTVLGERGISFLNEALRAQSLVSSEKCNQWLLEAMGVNLFKLVLRVS